MSSCQVSIQALSFNGKFTVTQALSLPNTLPASAGAQLDSFQILSPSRVVWTQPGTGYNCPVLIECASDCPYCLTRYIGTFALLQIL